MLKKLKMKFVCINMTIITAMLVFILCTVVHFTKFNLEQTNIKMLQDAASNPFYLMTLNNNTNMHLPYFSLRLNHKGEILETGGNYHKLSDSHYLQELVGTSSSITNKIGVLEEDHLRFLRLSTPTEDFLIFMDISMEISTIENLTRICVLIGIFSFFAFLGISIFFANWAVKPVEQAWTQQKEFIANASHELKTPLTIVLTNAEFLQSPNYDTTAKRQFLDNILAMSKQIKELVEGLLDLSRMDSDTIKTMMTEVDFRSLTENTAYVFESLYFENHLDLMLELDSHVRVHGSEQHLRQVLEILLENALKYAVAPSPVVVKLQRHRFHCVLSVSNHGKSIPEEDLQNLFRRFYQASHTPNHSGSYGLGLSIAESIVTKHHGKIWAESQNGINTFFVKLSCI